jgi:two-component system response regulator FixJ
MDPDLYVVVVDDDPSVRESLRVLMKSVGLPMVGYATAQDFLERQELDKVGCLVLDVRMPGMSGLDLQDRLRQRGVDVPTIVISGHADVPMTVRAIKAGAMDFLEKPFNQQFLLDRIQQAMEENSRRRTLRSQRAEFASRLELLTPREREVLDLLVDGKSNKEIALELDISRKTLDIHRAKVLHKMQADSVVQLVRMAMHGKTPCTAV